MPSVSRGAPKRFYWFLLCLGCTAFILSVQSRASFEKLFTRSLRPEEPSLVDRRCQGSAWPLAVSAPIGDAAKASVGDELGVQRCPQKAVFGDQRSWMAYVSSEFGFLFEALRTHHGWVYVTWIDAQSLDDILRQYAADYPGCAAPKLLLFVEQYAVLSRLNTTGRPHNGDTKIWLFADDLHWHTEQQHAMKAAGFAVADTILSTYPHKVRDFYPQVSQPMLPVPHSASPRFVMPLNGSPRNTILLSGAAGAMWYPYRAAVQQLIEGGDTRFAQMRHPGYDQKSPPGTGCAFADAIHEHIAALTDGSVLNYTIAKIFEIPATGALLLLNAEMMEVIRPLGFEPHIHYMPYTMASLSSVADAVLDPANRPAVDLMRRQGQQLVLARHTSTHRAAAIDAFAELRGKPVR